MDKPDPVEFRERVVAFVGEWRAHRAATAQFRVSLEFRNDMVILQRETGGREHRAHGNGGGRGSLGGLRDWIAVRMTTKAAFERKVT